MLAIAFGLMDQRVLIFHMCTSIPSGKSLSNIPNYITLSYGTFENK